MQQRLHNVNGGARVPQPALRRYKQQCDVLASCVYLQMVVASLYECCSTHALQHPAHLLTVVQLPESRHDASWCQQRSKVQASDVTCKSIHAKQQNQPGHTAISPLLSFLKAAMMPAGASSAAKCRSVMQHATHIS
jgi:hypothetical protein